MILLFIMFINIIKRIYGSSNLSNCSKSQLIALTCQFFPFLLVLYYGFPHHHYFPNTKPRTQSNVQNKIFSQGSKQFQQQRFQVCSPAIEPSSLSYWHISNSLLRWSLASSFLQETELCCLRNQLTSLPGQ